MNCVDFFFLPSHDSTFAHNSIRTSCSFFAHQTDGEDGDDDAFDGDAGGLFVNPTGPDGGAARSRTNPNPNDTAGTFLDRTTGRRLQNDPEPSRPRGSISIATGSDGRAMQVDNDPNNVGDETAVGRFTVSFSLVLRVNSSVLYVLNFIRHLFSLTHSTLSSLL